MITYLRWKAGEERRTPRGRMAPLSPDHPAVGADCPVCFERVEAGQPPALFAVGPDSPDALAKHDAGSWYSALAVIVHERCVWGDEQ